jgi:hypothetical protein
VDLSAELCMAGKWRILPFKVPWMEGESRMGASVQLDSLHRLHRHRLG